MTMNVRMQAFVRFIKTTPRMIYWLAPTRRYIAPKMLAVIVLLIKFARVLHFARGPLARKVVALLSLRALYAAAVSSVRLPFASSTTSSVMTVKRTRVAEPNVVEIATSAASRPRAMTIRPIRG